MTTDEKLDPILSRLDATAKRVLEGEVYRVTESAIAISLDDPHWPDGVWFARLPGVDVGDRVQVTVEKISKAPRRVSRGATATTKGKRP